MSLPDESGFVHQGVVKPAGIFIGTGSYAVKLRAGEEGSDPLRHPEFNSASVSVTFSSPAAMRRARRAFHWA